MFDYMAEYARWLSCAKDELTIEELKGIEGDTAEIEERFYTELEFGTAGLRGIMGAGTNRMNDLVVRRATAGLADYLAAVPGAAARGVAIGYDSRRRSREFALETALVLCAQGIHAFLFDTLHPVPLISFAIRKHSCIAGVVITASHNPPEYNGYKVYWEDGGQAGPEQASAILECIRKRDYFDVSSITEADALSSGLLEYIGEATDEAYYEKALSLLLRPELLREKGAGLKLVYTPLHGSGLVPVRTLLRRAGVSAHIVKSQELPDGNFPTVKAPNPDGIEAFNEAIKLADDIGADVIFATDPDADRLGVAVREHGRFNVLTGNQIGCVLLHYILSTRKELGLLPEDGFSVKSLVSTRMADVICARFGVRLEYVPTGFRFISQAIDRSEKENSGKYLFGFEESNGFLAGGGSRDKDAVSSALLLAEACVYYNERGMTLADVLCEMYAQYGFHRDVVKSYTLKGKEGLEHIAGAMRALRKEPLKQLNGIAVCAFDDLMDNSVITLADGRKCDIGMSGLNVLAYTLEDGAWFCVRPSGTEPKLKLYIGASDAEEHVLSKKLASLLDALDELMQRCLA